MFTVTFIDHWDNEIRSAVLGCAAALQGMVEVPEGNVSLKLVDDAQITALNKQYTGNAYATDVLSFNYQEDGETDGELGDIAISLETARRQAIRLKAKLEDEVALLATHGILHVLGYDHGDEPGQKEMEQLQRRIVKQAGFKYRSFKWE
ncbi:MAG TPA: rRNA maturation RNase YbeY [Candidatus Saccharimonadales bacterium]|nr:rRNA maturation RNase YbeY [Candidatus Saccharimonadales bacterium]